ncbi:MAG: TonB-dependent receptor plug domain-containing protein [Burkholderiales bacterium]
MRSRLAFRSGLFLLHAPAKSTHCLLVSLAAIAAGLYGASARSNELVVPEVVVRGSPSAEVVLERRRGLLERLSSATDSADLLQGQGGVSLYGAGGLSALPVLRGMADDRLRIKVDGMDLQSACPNHMNSPLSYIAPADVATMTVMAGITPVSAGGDSLGGTIEVNRERPRFAQPGEAAFQRGEIGALFRSNGKVTGGHWKASWSGESLHLSYSGSTARAENYRAARAFKAVEPGTEGGRRLAGDEVGSSGYQSLNNEVGFAWRAREHLLRLNLGEQHVLFEGYPNQRMDMTDNLNRNVNLRYEGVYDWGELDARLGRQKTNHEMDMGPDRFRYGTGMPMLTRAQTDSGEIHATRPVGDRDRIGVGAEFLRYLLYDWWPAVGGTMGPNAFWNIDNGRRNRVGAYAEWSRTWRNDWYSQLGVRGERIESHASPVQGYNNGLTALWGAEAAAFNARDHRHVDRNWDVSAQLRRAIDEQRTLELGYARKTRSPNLYQRYPWSTQAMAALMNNFAGDGNGYIGQEGLRPEVAHTLSVTALWRSLEPEHWQLKANAYVTRVFDYIDAQRCDFGQCSAANATTRTGFVLLQYVNKPARIEGLDVSGRALLGRSTQWGRFDMQGVVNLLRGTNLETGQSLYNMMPANTTLSIVRQHEGWSNTLEWQVVGGKRNRSEVRNEIPTGGYGLLHLRTSREWRNARLDLRIDNVFNRFHQPPLGGAYVGQGASMTTSGIPWGITVPGPGRSFSVALTFRY